MTPNLARSNLKLAPVLRRLGALVALGPEAEALVSSLSDFHSYRPGVELVTDLDRASNPRFLVSGWAARVRWLPDGRRQIFQFVLPGEGIGLRVRPAPMALSTTIALTSVTTVDASPVQRAIASEDDRWTGLRDAIHLAATYEEAHLLAQIMRLGRQSAYERIGHLLLELRDRLSAAGLAEAGRFPMPLTQEMMADATGLSIVHVNRILQQLRRERLVELQSGKVRLLDMEALESLADYRVPQPASRPPVNQF